MRYAMKLAWGLATVAIVAVMMTACSSDSSDDKPQEDTWVFDGASDALDGRFIGQLTQGDRSLGLILQVDQNRHLVYGPAAIGTMTGNFRGRFTGNDIRFEANVSEEGSGAVYQFTGRISNFANTLSGDYTAIVNGQAVSGTWIVRR